MDEVCGFAFGGNFNHFKINKVLKIFVVFLEEAVLFLNIYNLLL